MGREKVKRYEIEMNRLRGGDKEGRIVGFPLGNSGESLLNFLSTRVRRGMSYPRVPNLKNTEAKAIVSLMRAMTSRYLL